MKQVLISVLAIAAALAVLWGSNSHAQQLTTQDRESMRESALAGCYNKQLLDPSNQSTRPATIHAFCNCMATYFSGHVTSQQMRDSLAIDPTGEVLTPSVRTTANEAFAYCVRAIVMNGN